MSRITVEVYGIFPSDRILAYCALLYLCYVVDIFSLALFAY
jgi:hypothetical protein